MQWCEQLDQWESRGPCMLHLAFHTWAGRAEVKYTYSRDRFLNNCMLNELDPAKSIISFVRVPRPVNLFNNCVGCEAQCQGKDWSFIFFMLCVTYKVFWIILLVRFPWPTEASLKLSAWFMLSICLIVTVDRAALLLGLAEIRWKSGMIVLFFT